MAKFAMVAIYFVESIRSVEYNIITVAQSVYDKLGYKDDHEIHMSKRV